SCKDDNLRRGKPFQACSVIKLFYCQNLAKTFPGPGSGLTRLQNSPSGHTCLTLVLARQNRTPAGTAYERVRIMQIQFYEWS
ncbi:unnamed protein product, partial [Allacma fusca]